MVQNAVFVLASSELEWNCHYRNYSGIAIIGIGIKFPYRLCTGVGIELELLLSELELELNCKNGIDPDSGIKSQQWIYNHQ